MRQFFQRKTRQIRVLHACGRGLRRGRDDDACRVVLRISGPRNRQYQSREGPWPVTMIQALPPSFTTRSVETPTTHSVACRDACLYRSRGVCATPCGCHTGVRVSPDWPLPPGPTPFPPGRWSGGHGVHGAAERSAINFEQLTGDSGPGATLGAPSRAALPAAAPPPPGLEGESIFLDFSIPW